MTIELQPELEALIRTSLQEGSYPTVDAFVHDAVRLLHDRVSWLSANRDEVSRHIEEGWESAQRGELRTKAEVRANIQQHKLAWANRTSPQR